MSLYLVLDGPDGSGKSVQAGLLCRWLEDSGKPVEHLREPGSTAVGESLRNLLLDPNTGDLEPVTEALLFFAARAQMVRELVAPALTQGKVVVAERSYLSTLVYQGIAPGEDKGVPIGFLQELVRQTHGDTRPDALFVLDVDPEEAARRRHARSEDRFEGRGLDFQRLVREGYLALAQQDTHVQVVDANRRIEVVHQELRARVAALRERAP